MKKISKFFVYVAVAATTLISCQENIIIDPIQGDYTYTFSLSNSDSKAILDLDESLIRWEAGDKLGVYTNTSGNVSVNRYANVILSSPAEFQIQSQYALTNGSKVYCYFPYDATNSNGDSQNPALVSLKIPTVQSGKMNAMPMVSIPYTMTKAVEANTNEPIADINMRNLAGVFQFNIFSSNPAYCAEIVESVQLNADAAIAGSFTYDITSDGLSSISGLSETVVLVDNQHLTVGADKANSSKVLMVVAPGSHSGSLVVKTNVAAYTLNFSSAKDVVRSHIKPLNVDLNKASSRVARAFDSYEKLSSLSQINPYCKYIIVGHAYREAEAGEYAMSNSFSELSSSVKALSGTIVYPDNDVIKLEAGSNAYAVSFESTSVENQYLIKSGDYYLSYGASSTALAATTTKPTSGKGLWNISLSNGNAQTLGTFMIADESTKSGSTKRCIGFQTFNVNDTNSDKPATLRFAAYSIASIVPATSGSNDYSAIELYRYNDGKTDSDIAFSVSAKSIGLDDEITGLPTVTKSNTGNVTFTSSVPSVATVNASTGVVSLVGVGETIITASVGADETYRAGSASYTLTVTEPTRAFSVDATSIDVVAAGATGKTIAVTASPKVVWSMLVEDGITVTSCTAVAEGDNYKGSGVITFSVAQNSGVARVLPILLSTSTQYATATEITVNVNQAGAVVAKTFAVSPLSFTNVAAAGETKEVTITADDDVEWELAEVSTGLTFSIKSGNNADGDYAYGTGPTVLNVIVPSNASSDASKNYSFNVKTNNSLVSTKSYSVSISQLAGISKGTLTEDFEKQTAGQSYNEQQSYDASSSNAGIGWYVEHGTVSTTGVLTGSNSMHMRAYYAKSSAAGTWNGALPYMYSTTAVKGLKTVTFNAAASNTGIKYDVYYSTDGSSWTAIQTVQSLTTTSKEYTFSIPNSSSTTSYYIKIAASSSSTHAASPNKAGNYTFRVDDIVFSYEASLD